MRYSHLASMAVLLSLSACGGDVTDSGASGATTSGGGAAATSSGATSTVATGSASATGGGSGVTGSSTGTSTGSASTSTASTGTGGTCGDCGLFGCCDGACVNTNNDIHNCGSCGTVCSGPNPYCDLGQCGTAPCDPGSSCGSNGSCCGSQCCTAGELCCNVPGPVDMGPACTPPTQEGTCPLGCLGCACTSPGTPIATPSGERPIASLEAGDLVYSVDHGAIRAVPLTAVLRRPVENHDVVRLVLENGSVLEISATHPTADGRTFADLRAGGSIDRVRIVEATTIPYSYDSTYDVLPASETGTYVAGGVLVGSTLFGPVRAAD